MKNMQKIWREDIPLTTNPLRFVLFASRPYWLAAILGTIVVVVGAAFGAAMPYFLKNIINAAIAFQTDTAAASDLWRAAIIFILLSLGVSVLFRASGLLGMVWVTGVRATARYALSSYSVRHSYDYFSNRFAGSIANKIGQAANSADDMVEMYLWDVLTFVVTMIVSFALAFATSPLVALIFIGWVCVIIPLNIYRGYGRIPRSAAAQKAETTLTGATVDFLTNIFAVHEFARRAFELSKLKELVVDRRRKGFRNWGYGEVTLILNEALQVTFIGGMILLTIHLTVKGVLTPGDILLVLSIIIMVQDRLSYISHQISRFSELWGTITESLEDILIPHGITEKVDAGELIAEKGKIELQDISFSYGENVVFDHLSLSIPAGQRIGLVGRSGSGKSTLMKILLRHYDLNDGSILIDGMSIADVTKESLREHIAVVPQEPMLFHRSIRENIAYGNPNATEAEIIEAAKLSQADGFIRAFPGGYDVFVGERGVKLSGGQRQRIAIARALIKDAPVLLLDEATSALDSESEVLVQEALLELMKGRTVIAIAHRLSTLRAMDRILVLDQGKIIEDGTHEELLHSGALYASLWAHQSGGYLKEDGEEQGEK